MKNKVKKNKKNIKDWEIITYSVSVGESVDEWKKWTRFNYQMNLNFTQNVYLKNIFFMKAIMSHVDLLKNTAIMHTTFA